MLESGPEAKVGPKSPSNKINRRGACRPFNEVQIIPNVSAILSQPALGANPNPLASLGGIHAKPQFHLSPVFRPLPHGLT